MIGNQVRGKKNGDLCHDCWQCSDCGIQVGLTNDDCRGGHYWRMMVLHRESAHRARPAIKGGTDNGQNPTGQLSSVRADIHRGAQAEAGDRTW